MKTCPHCHIQVGGDTGYCPLCQNRLHGEQGSPWFPPTAPRIHRASLFYKIVAFVVLTLTVVAGAIDFLLLDTAHLHFSLLILVWGVAGLSVLRVLLRRRYNGPRLVFNLLLLVSALIVFTDWFTGYTGYSLDLVVPILCSVTLVCNYLCVSPQPVHRQRAGVSADEHRRRAFAVYPAVFPHRPRPHRRPQHPLGQLPDHQRGDLSGAGHL